MIRPAISIIFPHLRENQNDKALKIALDCIIDNTDIDYELIYESVERRRDIYPVLNNMAHRSHAEWIVFSNSDVFFAPGYASALYGGRERNTITTGIIAECGVIGVNPANYELHYGVTPEAFDRAGFEEWVKSDGDRIYSHKAHQARGWIFPCLINRKDFLATGGFKPGGGIFPKNSVDMDFWDKWEADGKHFRRVNSWCYHLQNLTSEDAERIANRVRLSQSLVVEDEISE